MDTQVLNELQTIPGVGKSISKDLWTLGVRSVADLRDRDPEELYARLCTMQQTQIDRCMLYVMRCAVYYASHTVHDPELLKWWAWKDRVPAVASAKKRTARNDRRIQHHTLSNP